MFLSQSRTLFTSSFAAGVTDPGLKSKVVKRKNVVRCDHGMEERIRETFTKVELSVSSYDTAWVAMVPSPGSPLEPCFPRCLKWLLESQLPDGSWGLSGRSPLLIKDSLLSTLACMLALRRWEDGEEHVRKGIEFIGSNFEAVLDKKQMSPIGFDIIFSGMARQAEDLGLNLSLNKTIFESILRKGDSEFARISRSHSKGEKAYLAYISEGHTELRDWGDIIKFQRKNGSLFNSPSTTAATLIQFQDSRCLEYLQSLLERFNSAVPAIYPNDKHIRLRMVDHLEKLGIDRHFSSEIKSVLDETHRCWLEKDEDIVLDIETRSLAFRLLRTNGYEVSSDALAEFQEEECFFDSLEGRLKTMNATLELYKASQITVSPEEPVLDKLQSWTSKFLHQQLSGGMIEDDNIRKQVDYALKFTYDFNVGRLETRRYIECYDASDVQMLKASYRCTNIGNRDYLQFAVEDYNFCQTIHQKELKLLERWVKESRLDQLKFARQRLTYIYFTAACPLFSSELSDARMSWTKVTFLVTIVDDFYDFGGGCQEELSNLIKLVENWDENLETYVCSEEVDIIFRVLYNTVNEFVKLAFVKQHRSVKSHVIAMWLEMLNSMIRESEWAKNKSIFLPTMEEYMSSASISIGFGPIIFTTIYLLVSELSEEIVRSEEFNNLFKHTYIFGRLSNDIISLKRERVEGKLNSVLLLMNEGNGFVTEQEAVKEIKSVIERNKRELLKLVLLTKGSVVPKQCKDLFWTTTRLIHLFYNKNDQFTSPDEIISAVNAVLYEPLNLL